MHPNRTALVWLAAIMAAISSGCAQGMDDAPAERHDPPSPPRIPDAGHVSPDGGQPGPGPDEMVECAPTDPNTLPTCCGMNGPAHCLADAQVPGDLRGELDACTGGGLCVP